MAGLFNSIDVSASGLTLQRRKMDAVAQNIANAETTKTDEGGPYRRKSIVVKENEETVPFKTAMTRARTKLYRTNSRHIPGSPRQSGNSIELSKSSGDLVEAPKDDFRLVYDPDHPDADEEGYVRMPDIDIITEMVEMMAASRAYEANTMAILTAKEIARNALDI
jgi:flagellar basal-body rod protein FlgC